MIRAASLRDADRLLEIYGWYVENTAVSFEYVPPSPEEFRGRISRVQEKYPWLVLEEDGVIRGYAYASAFHSRAAYSRCCAASIYLDREARGRGYGRKLYDALESELKGMGILNLYACIADPVTEDEYLTDASEQFHRHMGFTKTGVFHLCGYKFGRWYNMIWMEKSIGAHGSEEETGARE